MADIQTIKIFLASSSELREDREQFEVFINRKNKEYIKQGIFLELVIWEDFLDAMSATRLQDEYNKVLRECDVVVSLFKTKVGRYAEEEIMIAWETFKKNNKPLIYTYFKEAQIDVSTVNLENLQSLQDFKNKLSDLGHFYNLYRNIEDLKYKFSEQLIKIIPNLVNIAPKEKKEETSSQEETSKPLSQSSDISSETSNIEIFLSYHHKDEVLKDELTENLKLIIKQGFIHSWFEREITAGREWVGKIDPHINTAQIILLLVSPDYLASDYCYDIELRRALERNETGEAVVVPIILRPTYWKFSPFGHLEVLPTDERAITSWSNRDEAFLNVIQGIGEFAQLQKSIPITLSFSLKRVLILASNPKKANSLQLEKELRTIDEGLRHSQGSDHLIFKEQLATKPRDIQQAILEFQPNIVHFANCGAETYLSFEDDTEQNGLMSSSALADLFKLFSNQVECVLLNACYSEKQAAAIVEHIDYVIGMPSQIGEKTATAFTVGFYDALAAGKTVDFAYQLGCNAIQLEGLSKNLDPILLVSKERQILDRFNKTIEQFLEGANARFLGSSVFISNKEKRKLQIVSLRGRLESYGQLPILFVEQPTAQDVVELKDQAIRLSGDPWKTAGIIVYLDPPDALFRVKMAEVRLEDHVILIPIPFADVEKALIEENASAGVINDYADRYLPGTDFFNYRNAIGDTLSFFGRSKLLHDLEKDLQKGQGIGLFGLRKSGKTSLLLQLGSALRKHPIVHIDLQGYGGKPYFGAELFNEILTQFCKLLKIKKSYSIKPIKSFERDIPAASVATAFIEQVEKLAQELEQANFEMPLLIFLDEIERIFPFETDSCKKVEEFNAFFGALRNLSQTKRTISLLVADVHADCNQINQWRQQGVSTSNPVYQFFKETFVIPFTPEETQTMLTDIGRLMGKKFDDSTIKAIHHESGGYPFVARQIASFICSNIAPEKKEVISYSEAEECLEDLTLESATLSSYLRESIWNDLEKRQDSSTISSSKAAMSILRILACSQEANLDVNKQALLSKIQQDFTKNECFDAILWLEAVGLIIKKKMEKSSSSNKKNNYKYEIQMPLLSHWLIDSMTENEIAQWKI